MQIAKCKMQKRRRAILHFAFCILHFASPPNSPLLRAHPLHPLELFLLLLLHRAQQRLGIRILLLPLLLLLPPARRLLLTLLPLARMGALRVVLLSALRLLRLHLVIEPAL